MCLSVTTRISGTPWPMIVKFYVRNLLIIWKISTEKKFGKSKKNFLKFLKFFWNFWNYFFEKYIFVCEILENIISKKNRDETNFTFLTIFSSWAIKSDDCARLCQFMYNEDETRLKLSSKQKTYFLADFYCFFVVFDTFRYCFERRAFFQNSQFSALSWTTRRAAARGCVSSM